MCLGRMGSLGFEGATSNLEVCSTSCAQLPVECCKKTVKRRRRRDGTNVAQTLDEWRAINDQLHLVRKAPTKGSKRGCMRGKGGPENGSCKYRGVRQRAWGNWVAEIRVPKGNKRLWLGTFSTSIEAALSYDEAAKAMYGASATLNFPYNNTSISQEKATCMGNDMEEFAQHLQECLSIDEMDDSEFCNSLATSSERLGDDQELLDHCLQQFSLMDDETELMLDVDELLGEVKNGDPSVTPLDDDRLIWSTSIS